MRRRFREMVYAGSQPGHLAGWLTEWNTPLFGIRTASAVTDLTRVHRPKGLSLTCHMGSTKDRDDTGIIYHTRRHVSAIAGPPPTEEAQEPTEPAQ
jgi:hypothetical protein